MYLLLSGEGPSDIGCCNPALDSCDANNFKAGPMAYFVDKLIEEFQGYEMSHIATERVSFVSESYLSTHKQRPASRKSMFIRGKNNPPETHYYFKNARALAVAAKQKSIEINDNVIAVLFRDADGTASAERGNWQDKYNSMRSGFEFESYGLGVAMLPNPKSEAWLLCAVKPNAYQHCEALEQESGNDRSANPLKIQLERALNNNASTLQINELMHDNTIDVLRIDMPSYNTFKADLEGAVRLAVGIP